MMMMRRRMRMIMMMMTHCHHHQFGLPHFSVHNRESLAQAIFGIMIIAAIHGSDYLLVVGFSFFNLFSPFPELNASWLIPRLTCFIYFRQPRFFCATTNSFQNNHFGDKTTRCWCFFVFWGFTFCNWHIKWASLLQSTRSHICFLECHRFLITYWQISLQLFGLFTCKYQNHKWRHHLRGRGSSKKWRVMTWWHGGMGWWQNTLFL